MIGHCRRRGSLDQKVEPGSIVANDFGRLFRTCPRIRLVVFNGRLAEQSFERHVRPALPPSLARIASLRLPSTSPAHAAMSFEQKFDAWRVALAPILAAQPEQMSRTARRYPAHSLIGYHNVCCSYSGALVYGSLLSSFF